MSSKLSLAERLDARVKRPRELTSWSSTEDEPDMHFDDRALRYYYSPRNDLSHRPINLKVGFETSGLDPLAVHGKQYIDRILKGLIHLEQENNEKTDASIFCWRGLLTQLLVLSQGSKDRRLLNEAVDFYVVGFDGQIFICDKPRAVKPFSGSDASLQNLAKFMYSGFSFEHMATLPEPWGSCTREQIEHRYDEVPPLTNKSEYNILVKSGIGNVSLVYGAEVDCVEGAKDPEDKLKNYVELKTTMQITCPDDAQKFESKLLKSWTQSFLAGVPKVTYGFRDRDLNLCTIEEFKTEALPAIARRSQVTFPEHRWNGNDVIKFYGILVQWLKDKVQDGETYELVHEPKDSNLVLRKAPIEEGRKVAFLSDEFVEWRETLRERTQATE